MSPTAHPLADRTRALRSLIVLTGSVAIACESTPEPAATHAHANSSRASAAVAPSDQPSAPPSAHPAPALAPSRVDFRAPAMGTELHFVAYTTPQLDPTGVRAAMERAVSEVRRIEARMSTFRPDSEISRINAAGGRPLRVSEETLTVIERSLWISRQSAGRFDISYHAMSNVWKFGDDADPTPRLPDPHTVSERRALIDYRKITTDSTASTVTLGAGMSIGLGGIAKGYAVDRAAMTLRQAGLTSFLAQAGGDLYAAGTKPGGEQWVSGVRDPRGGQDDFFAVMKLEDRAFSTAGDYARAFISGGRRYHHIIDPTTGYPATACRSVTIWAEDAFTADAVDDAVFILGPERGLELVESLPGVGALIVDAKNEVHISARLRGNVIIRRAPTDGI